MDAMKLLLEEAGEQGLLDSVRGISSLTVKDVDAKVWAAEDWREVLKWEGHLEMLLAHQPDGYCEGILAKFSNARRSGYSATGSSEHARSFIALEERRVTVLGELERFRDQGQGMCSVANVIFILGNPREAARWFQLARDVGKAHGLFAVEGRACQGLGTVAMQDGRTEKGLALLRNALEAAKLNEMDDLEFQLGALVALIDALFIAQKFDELELDELVP